MSGLTIKFENSFAAGNTSLSEGTAKIYAFTGSPIDAYTKFTFSIHNGGPTLTGIKQIDLTFPKNILASDLSDNNFALLSGVLKAAFPGFGAPNVTMLTRASNAKRKYIPVM